MDPRLYWLLSGAALCGCFSPTGSGNTSNSTSTSTSVDASSGTVETATTDLPSSTATASTDAASSNSTSAATSTTSGAVCGDGHIDEGEACDDGPLAAGCSSSCQLYRRVFVTSQVFPGDLGGLTGADAKCQEAAVEVNLPGNYFAWLSSSNDSPEDRFVHSSIPYRLVDGNEIAINWDDLTDGTLATGITVSEKKGAPGKGTHSCLPTSASIVWTNTKDAGTTNGGQNSCGEWGELTGQGSTGIAGRVDFSWTSNCLATCTDEAAIYCFEQ